MLNDYEKMSGIPLHDLWNRITKSPTGFEAQQMILESMGRGLGLMLRAHFTDKPMFKILHIPHYKSEEAPDGLSPSNLRQDASRLYDIFFKHPDMSEYRRSELLANILCAVDTKDAYLIQHIMEADPGKDFRQFAEITKEWIFALTEEFVR